MSKTRDLAKYITSRKLDPADLGRLEPGGVRCLDQGMAASGDVSVQARAEELRRARYSDEERIQGEAGGKAFQLGRSLRRGRSAAARRAGGVAARRRGGVGRSDARRP